MHDHIEQKIWILISCSAIVGLQAFSRRMYELIKEKIGVTAELPVSSSSSDDDSEPVEAPAVSSTSSGDDTDKSEL